MGEPVKAFVPGHITGFFSVHTNSDPCRAGSKGAGITLSEGVTVEITEGTGVELNGSSIEIEPVENVLASLGKQVKVCASTQLPLGAGFGISGALSLGTAFATNDYYNLGFTENELIQTAHVAEVTAGTGLGDVVAQARGGIPIRTEPGSPPHGQLDGIPSYQQIEYITLGRLSTEEILSGDISQINTAGEKALRALKSCPTVNNFMDQSFAFAQETDLLPESLLQIINEVASHSGAASMAMLGETVFTIGNGLSNAGYSVSTSSICHTGAYLHT